MRTNLALLCLLLACQSVWCDSQTTTAVYFSPPIHELSQNLFEVARKEKNNFAVSPVSIYFCLSMLFEGAGGNNLKELQRVLRLPDDSGLRRSAVKYAIENLNKVVKQMDFDENYNQVEKEVFKVSLANSAWLEDSFSVKPNYVQVLKEHYSAEVNSRDLMSSFSRKEVVSEINNWVEKKTFGLIKQTLSEIPEQTLLILVNTVYFKALWMVPFEKESTQSLDFKTGSGNSVKKDFMTSWGLHVNYFAENGSQFLELLYRTGKHSMVFKFGSNGPDHITQQQLHKATQQRLATRSNLKLPKVDLASDFDLKHYLQSMGLSSIFRVTADGFSNLSDQKDLFVSQAIHKTKVIINEAGTEAAAVTVMMVGVTSVMPSRPLDIVIDHPFSFYLYDKENDTILFSGAIVE